jgi:cell division protein FtsQ
MRRTATAPTLLLPADVRLLQASTQVVLLLALVSLCLLLLTWVARQPVFALRGIRIEGDLTRVNQHTLRANVTPYLQGSFITLDLRRTRQAFEAVPWVRRAVVRKVWPMRLVVQIEEHRVAALWGEEGGSDRLVNLQGEVFEANVGDVEDEGLPRLVGPEGSAAQMLAMVRRLGPVLAGLDGGETALLRLSPRGSWRVQLDQGARVDLGRGSEDEVLARTQRFVGTMPRVVAAYQRPLESADLRHNGGFAVRLKGITTGAPPPPVRRRVAG